MRFRKLLRDKIEVDNVPLRKLAREIGLPSTNVHDYCYMNTEPRVSALQKMSTYFGEPISQLLSDEDDLSAQIMAIVRKMPDERKQLLLEGLTKNHD